MMARKRIYLSALIAWVALTLALTSVPNPEISVSLPYADKAAHFFFYGVMGFLCAMWRRESGAGVPAATMAGVLFATGVGALDEFHQAWIPGRSMELLDWIADAAGGGFGALFSAFLPSLLPFLLTE